MMDASYLKVPSVTLNKVKAMIIEPEPKGWLMADGELLSLAPTYIEVHPSLINFFGNQPK